MNLIFGKPHATSFAGGGRQPLPKAVYLVLEWPQYILIMRAETEGGGALIAVDGMYDALANLPKGKSDVRVDELADDGKSYTLIVDGVAHKFIVPQHLIVTEIAPQPITPAEQAPPPVAVPPPPPVQQEPQPSASIADVVAPPAAQSGS